MSTTDPVVANSGVYEYNRIQIRRALSRGVFTNDQALNNANPIVTYKEPVESGFSMGYNASKLGKGKPFNPLGNTQNQNPLLGLGKTKKQPGIDLSLPEPVAFNPELDPKNEIQARLFKLTKPVELPPQGLSLTGINASLDVKPKDIAENRGIRFLDDKINLPLKTTYAPPFQELKYGWWAPQAALQESIKDTNQHFKNLVEDLQNNNSNGVSDPTTGRSNGGGGLSFGMFMGSGSGSMGSGGENHPDPNRRPFSRMF